MHHVALDRTGRTIATLDDEVVEGPRLHSRQHRHLRTALDLERAERVCPPDHREVARILGGDRCEVEVDALMLAQKVEPPTHSRQHAEGEDIHLHELQRVDVVLVPLDDLTISHRSRLDGDEFVEAVRGLRTKPPGCCDRWRGKPTSWPASSSASRSRRPRGSG